MNLMPNPLACFVSFVSLALKLSFERISTELPFLNTTSLMLELQAFFFQDLVEKSTGSHRRLILVQNGIL